MNNLEIKQISNGTAFDNIGTSFLIDLNDRNKQILLFDASAGSFEYLKNNSNSYSNMNYIEYNNLYIYISHTHLDHISDLEKIIFYRYFHLNNKNTTLIIHPTIHNELKFLLKKLLKTFKNNTIENLDMKIIYSENNFKIFKYNFLEIYELKENFNITNLKLNNPIKDFKLKLFKTDHIVCDSYGLLLYNNENVYILTGDTKASINIKNILETLIANNNIKQIFIYHDFNNYNNPFNSIHACQKDIDFFYGTEILKNKKINFKKVHNGN